jgi:hypothetical protein
MPKPAAAIMNRGACAASPSADAMPMYEQNEIRLHRRKYVSSIGRRSRLYDRALSRRDAEPVDASMKSANGSR